MGTVTGADMQIRWLIRRDMNEILQIEKSSFQFPWTEKEFLLALRQRNVIALVAESSAEKFADKFTKRQSSVIYGFMIYELHPGHFSIRSLAVAPEVRRTGIGTALIQRLKETLSKQRRRSINTLVRESNLPAQLFMQSQEFKAVEFIHGHYCHTEEGAIQFEFTRNCV